MKRLLVKLVKFYQLSISPLKAPCCKYYPTCSNYAIEAIERFGAFKGFFIWQFTVYYGVILLARAVMILFLKKRKSINT